MKKSYIFAGISIFFWSTVAVTTKLLLDELNNFQLLWASSLFAGLSLLIVNIVSGNIKKLKTYRFKDYLITILIGFPGTSLYYIFYYGGADMLPASQAFIINYLWPIMSVVFACIILKEKLTLRKVIAIIISFLGVAVVTCSELVQLNKNTITGTILCILAAVSYGVFTSLNLKVSYDKPTTMMVSYFVTFILTTVINLVNGDIFLPGIGQTLGFAWNGIFTMGVANTLWVLALVSGKTAKISNLAYITPFLSLVWTSLILKEELTLYSIIGLIIIVIGILIQLNDKRH